MPFTPHSDAEVQTMLATIGASSIDDLFDEIPAAIRAKPLDAIPEHIGEAELARIMQVRARQDETALNFIGAGAYQHHVPAVVWDIVSRGEIMTAYTPYQAEASQGNLQLIYEYQTMMANLMDMDVSNASLYDGASALAEAVLMAVRVNRKSKSKRIVIAGTIAPNYVKTAESITCHQGVQIEMLPIDQGHASLEGLGNDDIAAVVIPQPTFLGNIQEVSALTDWAHSHGALVIGLVNPTVMSVLTPPGQWGEQGADIVCGEGQPLGVPLASGGPYFGFMCCRQAIVRQLPGRIVGRTVDADGQPGFVLTLQAREQHIRRAKATSNVCTNQGLLMSAATIYMSLMGPEGLKRVALASYHNVHALAEQCAKLPGVSVANTEPFFHECMLKLPCAAQLVIDDLAEQGIQAGYDLVRLNVSLADCLMICSTEVHTAEDHQQFVAALSDSLVKHQCTAAIA